MSLVNVMVFLLFVMMLTAQLFLFAKNAVDEAADEREMMVYRLKLDSLVEEAKEVLRKGEEDKPDERVIDYTDFYKERKAKELKGDNAAATIYDLDYEYNYTGTFDRRKWQSEDKKIFAAMNPPIESGDTQPRYRCYLIRAQAKLPEKFYGGKLMYQVLVSRDESNYSKLQTLSFQEIWF